MFAAQAVAPSMIEKPVSMIRLAAGRTDSRMNVSSAISPMR